MQKKDIDWSSLGFGYIKTDKRFVAHYKNGKWDEGQLVEDDTITLNECAGVLQYAQTCFEVLKHIQLRTAELFASALTLMQAVSQILAVDFKFRLFLKKCF